MTDANPFRARAKAQAAVLGVDRLAEALRAFNCRNHKIEPWNGNLPESYREHWRGNARWILDYMGIREG